MECPKCKKEIEGVPAISRYDNKTQICADCGTREALEIIGESSAVIENVIDKIHGIKDTIRTK